MATTIVGTNNKLKDTPLAEIERFLGRLPDASVASRLGISAVRVGQLRRARGIPSYREQRSPDWSSVQHLLGVSPDSAIAAHLGVTNGAVAHVRRAAAIAGHQTTDWTAVVDLGKVPDRVIADRLGFYNSAVATARRKLGIPAFTGMILSQEGLSLRSVDEALYDAHLHARGIEHAHETHLVGRFRADFLIDGVDHEVVGGMGMAAYAAAHERKRKVLAAADIPVVWLSRPRIALLYSQAGLPLCFRNEYRCTACSESPKRGLARGLCERCFMRALRAERTTLKTCLGCARAFRTSRVDAYCGQACRARAKYPPLAVLLEAKAERRLGKLAAELAIPSKTLAHFVWRHTRIK